jgi:hypothetical protein
MFGARLDRVAADRRSGRRPVGPRKAWGLQQPERSPTTGEPVWLETPLPGAVLTRVASSHIRVGTFQFFAARGDLDAIRCLADHVIARHYPEAVDAANRYRTLVCRL